MQAEIVEEAHLTHVEAAGAFMVQAEARQEHLTTLKALRKKLKVSSVARLVALCLPSSSQPTPQLMCMFQT